MNLKTFDSSNTVTVVKGSANVRLNFKHGTINFTKEGMALIGLKHLDQIKIHQDKDNKQDWYLEKVKDGGLPLYRKTGRDEVGLSLRRKSLVEEMFKEMEIKVESISLKIAGKPTLDGGRKLWGLLIVGLKEKI